MKMSRMTKKFVRLGALALSVFALFSATHTTQAFAEMRNSFEETLVATPLNLAGVSWNADYTVCTLNGTVDAAALKAEMAQHVDTLTELTSESGSAITGDATGMSAYSYQLRTANLEKVVMNTGELKGMFKECTALKTLIMPKVINTTSALSFGELCNGCINLTNVSIPGQINIPQYSSFNLMFQNCRSLKTLDLSQLKTAGSQAVSFAGMFLNCDALEEVNLGDFAPGSDWWSLAMFGHAEDLAVDDPLITGGIPNIKRITISSQCNLEPGEGDYMSTATGTFFDYKEPKAWSAYYEGESVSKRDTSNAVPDATLVGYDEFRAYQQSHPGMTTYVFDEEPIPGPEPTPSPDVTPASTDADNGALPQTGDTLAPSVFLAVAALSGAVPLVPLLRGASLKALKRRLS